jgi:ferredoxin
MKVRIDREECTSCALCWDSCPKVFEENPDDGFSQIVEGLRVGGDSAVGEVPDSERACVEQAAEDCPVEVIHVES